MYLATILFIQCFLVSILATPADILNGDDTKITQQKCKWSLNNLAGQMNLRSTYSWREHWQQLYRVRIPSCTIPLMYNSNPVIRAALKSHSTVHKARNELFHSVIANQMRQRRNRDAVSLLSPRSPATPTLSELYDSFEDYSGIHYQRNSLYPGSRSVPSSSSSANPRSFPVGNGDGSLDSPSSSSSSSSSSLVSQEEAANNRIEDLLEAGAAAMHKDARLSSVLETVKCEMLYNLPEPHTQYKPAFYVPDDGKMIVVFDLDETLVEVSSESDWPHPLLPLPKESIQIGRERYYVTRRPGMAELLEWCAPKFHLVLWTSSRRYYARQILHLIDPQKHYFPKDRRFYADFNQHALSWTVKPKDLSLLGQDMRRIVMIDNLWKNFESQLIEVALNNADGGPPIIKRVGTNGILVRDFTVLNLITFGENVYIQENQIVMEYLEEASLTCDARHASIQAWLVRR